MPENFDFEAKDYKLEDVLFSNRKYRIPRYQRAYTWSLEEASDFWDDIWSNDSSYFLGSFIFNNEFEERSGFADIIDGQQRLLTITIFCAVLRDQAKGLHNTDKASLFQRKDIAVEDKHGKQSYRIIPSDTLLDYFVKNIQLESGNPLTAATKTAEEKKVQEVYTFFFTKVSDALANCLSLEEKFDLLDKLRNKIYELTVIRVDISHEEDAYEIFETTNARGVDLSVGDLLKNMIFKNIPERDSKDFAKEVWSQITSNIESTRTEVKKFIRYYWLSKYKFVTEKKVYKEIKKNTSDWQKLLSSLWDDSIIFKLLMDGEVSDFSEYKNAEELFDAISSFQIMQVSQIYVLLLSIFRNYNKLKTDPLHVIEFLENYTFQYSIVCKQPANFLEKIYSSYAIKIENAIIKFSESQISAEIQRIFSNLKKELLERQPDFEFFKSKFSEISYKSSSSSRMLIKYIFERIEKYYNPENEKKINFSKVNIEHLLPQNPDEEWGLTVNEIKDYVNLLGNLTILSKRINGRIKNKLVEKKLKDLKESKIEITKKLVEDLEQNGTDWTKERIIKRHDELADLGYKKVWVCKRD